ncbi:hypothetical protein NLI96_g8608 [Meripilus lineatus]|uniref:Response regulatory domain-containing protein n=1 Tax=Meripilus lineatus TaxID=2056292 RepID=A0AAD5UX32_9APHY|nr:hypothetical protein NLI96_g8608 [Physisporinus lineatus]
MTRRITPENAIAGQSATVVPIVPPMSLSVLIADDNPINRTILSTFMRKKKIKYDVANNGEEVVQKWRSGTFHLILMDIQMPVMDGIQATKEIRRIEKQNTGGFPSTQRTPSKASTDSRSASTPHHRSSVIIIALAASSLQADRVAALAAGCNDFLTKPVSLEGLNNKIIDIRSEVARGFSSGQAAQAQNVARRLNVPEGRSTSTIPRSRSPTHVTTSTVAEIPSFIMPAGEPRSAMTSNSPSPEETIGGPPRSSSERPRSPVPTLQVQPPSTNGLAAAQCPLESPVIVPPPMAAGRRGTSEPET